MSNNGSINDALDKAQRGLLDFFFQHLVKAITQKQVSPN